MVVVEDSVYRVSARHLTIAFTSSYSLVDLRMMVEMAGDKSSYCKANYQNNYVNFL